MKELIRLNKFISNSGLCSRREADIYISMGEVKVNGEIINQLGYKIKSGDKVYLNGQEITGQKYIYIILNKPKGYLATTNEKNQNRLCRDLISIKKMRLQLAGPRTTARPCCRRPRPRSRG